MALKYEQGEDAAPTCVAKGLDSLALKIRSVALLSCLLEFSRGGVFCLGFAFWRFTHVRVKIPMSSR